MSRKKHPKSRWVAGNERYDEATRRTITRKYSEENGWHKGAKVSKRKG